MANLIDNTSAFLKPLKYNDKDADTKEYIDGLISVASEYIEDFCNRTFLQDDYTDEVHDGTGEAEIAVDNPPINSLTDIDIISTSFNGDTTTTTHDSDKFDINQPIGIIRFKPGSFLAEPSHFSEGFQNVKITYNGGFAEVPQQVQYLAAQFVIERFDPTEIPGILQKERLGDYFYAMTKDFADKFMTNNKRMLSRYKLWKV